MATGALVDDDDTVYSNNSYVYETSSTEDYVSSSDDDDKDSNHLIWSGPSSGMLKKTFSDYKHYTIDNITSTFKGVVIEGKRFDFRISKESETVLEDTRVEEGLGILIRHVADETGRINCLCADRKWMKMKIDSFNAKDQRRGIKKRRVEGMYFDEDGIERLAALMPRLKKEHDDLLAHKPLFRNDTFKQFMKELIEFVLFDQQLKYKVSINTASNTTQTVYLHGKAISENDASEVLKVGGHPDVVLYNEDKQAILHQRVK